MVFSYLDPQTYPLVRLHPQYFSKLDVLCFVLKTTRERKGEKEKNCKILCLRHLY